MSPLNFALKKETNIFQWTYYEEFLKNTNHRSFLKDFSVHYQDIKKAKDKASDDLFAIEEEKLEQVKDFFRKSIFARSQFKKETDVINGLEGKDYTKEQHVEFIVKNYIKVITDTMLYAFGKDKNQLGTIYRALECFSRIALVEYKKGLGKQVIRECYELLKLPYEDV